MDSEEVVQVDVEAIMREITRKAHGLPSPAADRGAPTGERTQDDFDQAVDVPEFLQALDHAYYHHDIPYYWPFEGNPVKVFLKRVVRKLCKCIIPVVMAMQNGFNASVVACLNQLRDFMFHTRDQERAMRREMDLLRGSLEEQNTRLTALAGDNTRLLEQAEEREKRFRELESLHTQLCQKVERQADRIGELTRSLAELTEQREADACTAEALRAEAKALCAQASAEAKVLCTQVSAEAEALRSRLEEDIRPLKSGQDSILTRLMGHDEELAAHRESIRGYEALINGSSYLEQARRKLTADPMEVYQGGRSILRDNQLLATVYYAGAGGNVPRAFPVADVAVLLVASDSYVSYLGTLIWSIIRNASPLRTYDILVFETDMTAAHMNQLHGLTAGHFNVSVRFLDVNGVIQKEKFCIPEGSRYNFFTTLRLAAPDLLPNYDKILYLDADTLVNTDIAPLYDTDVRGYCLAGTQDLVLNGLMYFENDTRSYLRSIDITEPGTYMQAGVILLHLEELRRNYPQGFFLDKSYRETYTWLDQDLLNRYCKGRIKFVDLAWNVVALKTSTARTLEHILPEPLYQQYLAARREPKVIHYTYDLLPDKYPDGDMMDLYWKYARETPFYEQLLYR